MSTILPGRASAKLNDLRELTNTIRQLAPDDPPVLRTLGEYLPSLFQAPAYLAYRPVVRESDGKWSIDFVEARGIRGNVVPLYEGVFSRLPDAWQPGFNVTRPEPWQRNRALRPFGFIPRPVWEASPIRNDVAVPAGMGDRDQLRVLLCDDSNLLAWVGVFRDEAFRKEDVRALSSLIAPLRNRLVLERRLADAEIYGQGFERALALLPLPAYLLRWDGHVAHANEQGRHLLTVDDDVPRRMHAEVLSGAHREFEITPLLLKGTPTHHLVVRIGTSDAVRARLDRLASVWHLSVRQREVLGCLARGDSNKTIATRLGCSVRTIELHVTAILRKSASGRRTDLLAKVLG